MSGGDVSGTEGLNEEEREALAKAVVSDFVDHAHHNPAHGLGVFDRSRCDGIVAPAVERILASHTVALTAERDALREQVARVEAECDRADDGGPLGGDDEAWVEVAVIRAALHPTDGAS